MSVWAVYSITNQVIYFLVDMTEKEQVFRTCFSDRLYGGLKPESARGRGRGDVPDQVSSGRKDALRPSYRTGEAADPRPGSWPISGGRVANAR